MNDTGPRPKAAAQLVQLRGLGRYTDMARSWWQVQPRHLRWSIAALAVLAAYLLPYWGKVDFIPGGGRLAPFDTPGTAFASVLSDRVIIIVLVALGLNVVVGLAGLLDLGYVGFYAVGAYATAVITTEHGNWPWLASVPVSVGVSMLAGVVLGAPTLRLRGDYLAIVTLGFGEIIRITANNSEWLGASSGINKIPHPPSIGPLKFGVLDGKPYYFLGLTVVIVVIFFVHRLEHSRVGRAWLAIREDEDAAELMGVPTFRYKLWAFAIGAAIGGLAGTLYAGKVSFINPDTFPLQLSILFLAAVVLGGAGNMPGVILGAVLVGYLPERFRNFQDKRFLVFGIVLVLVMIFRPAGLLPRRVGGRPADEVTDVANRPDAPWRAGRDLTDTLDFDGGPTNPGVDRG